MGKHELSEIEWFERRSIETATSSIALQSPVPNGGSRLDP